MSQRSSYEEPDPSMDVKIAAAASLLMPPNISKAMSSKQLVASPSSALLLSIRPLNAAKNCHAANM